MKLSYKKSMILVALIFMLLSLVMRAANQNGMPDSVKGLIAGIQIGLLILPVITYNRDKRNCAALKM